MVTVRTGYEDFISLEITVQYVPNDEEVSNTPMVGEVLYAGFTHSNVFSL